MKRLLLLVPLAASLCQAKAVSRRDPLDGALFSHLIAIVHQESPGVLEIDEVFAGDRNVGQHLDVPDFDLKRPDGTPEPYTANTRILVFLNYKQAANVWTIGGSGNLYFWSHDPANVAELRALAKKAVDLRKAWWAANSIEDQFARARALLPFIWSHEGRAAEATSNALILVCVTKDGHNSLGDALAEILPTLTSQQFAELPAGMSGWPVGRLQAALHAKMKAQEARWDALVAKHGEAAVHDALKAAEKTQRGEAMAPLPAEVADISGWFTAGVKAIATFPDRDNTAHIRELGLWAAQRRMWPLVSAVLDAFGEYHLAESLPVIERISAVYGERPMVDDDSEPYDIVISLSKHRYPEAIPLMAKFAGAKYTHPIVHDFLRKMTDVELGDEPAVWLAWYESHKRELGVD